MVHYQNLNMDFTHIIIIYQTVMITIFEYSYSNGIFCTNNNTANVDTDIESDQDESHTNDHVQFHEVQQQKMQFQIYNYNEYPSHIYCDYFVVSSSLSKVLIRLHGTNKIDLNNNIYKILYSGPFNRNAFIGSIIRNGTSQLNQLKNEKLYKIFFDLY
eukprot:483609_1